MDYARLSQGSIRFDEITSDSVTFTLVGFEHYAPEWHVEVAVGTDLTAPWENIGKNLTYTKKGLKPNTEYNVWAKLIDGFAGESFYANEKFRTEEDVSKVNVKVSGTWKKGKLFVNSKGYWKKAKKTYIQVNGTWKKGV